MVVVYHPGRNYYKIIPWNIFFSIFSIRNSPAWHRGLPGPSGLEPQKSPKRVHKGVPGPPAPESPKVPKECAPESEKSLKRVRSCVFGLFSDSGAHSLGTVGLPGASRDTLSDSFRTFLGLRARRARENSVPGRGVPNFCNHFVIITK